MLDDGVVLLIKFCTVMDDERWFIIREQKHKNIKFYSMAVGDAQTTVQSICLFGCGLCARNTGGPTYVEYSLSLEMH
jgi:hypothetical protein